MNRRKISALLLSCTLAMNISSFNEIVLADENKGEEVQNESHNESNCIAGDYHEVNNKLVLMLWLIEITLQIIQMLKHQHII